MGGPQPQQISFILSETGARGWLLADFFTKPMIEAGQDRRWHWTSARESAQNRINWMRGSISMLRHICLARWSVCLAQISICIPITMKCKSITLSDKRLSLFIDSRKPADGGRKCIRSEIFIDTSAAKTPWHQQRNRK